MKKSLIWMVVSVCLLISRHGYAQSDSYTQTFLEVLKVDSEYKQLPEQLMTSFKPMFDEINKNLLQDPSQSDQVIKQYTSQFYVDVVSVLFVPAMKDKVTEAELKLYAEKMSTPSGKLFMEHNNQLKQIGVLALLGEMASQLGDEKAMEQFNNGKMDLKQIDQKSEIPNEYAELFYTFYNQGESSYSKLIDEMGNSHPAFQNATGKQREVLSALITYLKSNMGTLMLNSSYGVLTVDDLKFGVEIQPVLQKMADGFTDIFKQMKN